MKPYSCFGAVWGFPARVADMNDNDDDLELQAFLDGEMDAGAMRIFMDRIASSPRLQERLRQLTAQKEKLRQWWLSEPRDN